MYFYVCVLIIEFVRVIRTMGAFATYAGRWQMGELPTNNNIGNIVQLSALLLFVYYPINYLFLEFVIKLQISICRSLAAKGTVGALEERPDPSGRVPCSADQGARGGYSASQGFPQQPAQVKDQGRKSLLKTILNSRL